VSKNTIRRDLNDLEERGHITKVYGGVTAVPSAGAVPVPVRSEMNLTDKNLIGRLAADLVEDGDTIFIDSGTTAVCMLRFLGGRRRITVITHSLGTMAEAAKYDNLSIISLGGIYNPVTDSFVGVSTFESLSSLRIQKAFMAATGVSIENGMMNTTFLEAEIKRAAVGRADHVCLMADASKLDKEAVLSFCRLKDLDAFITDRRPPEKYMEYLTEHNVRICYE
jgi:DeoR family myo-inositol catabolism operon transcriptional repressor